MLFTERLSYNIIYLIGLSIVFLFGVIVFTGLLSLFLHIPLGFYTLSSSIILFFITHSFFLKWYADKNIFQSTIISFISLLIVGICLAWSSQYHENFFDANWYHHDAVYNLAKGWNPYDRYLMADETSYCEFYLNFFPKGYWVYGAIIYLFTHTIEAAKGMDLALIIACAMILCGGLFKQNFSWSKSKSIFIGLMVALNPIAISNVFSFYVDGPIGILLSIGILFSLAQLYGKDDKAWLLAFVCFAILFHLKFTGTAFAILFLFAFFVLLVIKNKTDWKPWLIKFSVFVVFVVLISGFHPFISNTIDKGHPFFPAVENDDIKVFKRTSYPDNFIDKDRLTKFYLSLYAIPGWHGTPDNSKFKEPFSLIDVEIYGNGIPDLGALGPWFSEFFTLAFMAYIISLFFIKNNKTRLFYIALVLFFVFTFFINKEAWVFRYIPHLWLLAIVFVTPLFDLKYGRWFSVFLLIGLFYNDCIMAREITISQHKKTKELNKQLDFLRGNEMTYAIYPGWGKSFKNKLGENRIDTSKWLWINPKDTPYTLLVGSLGGTFKLRKEVHVIK